LVRSVLDRQNEVQEDEQCRRYQSPNTGRNDVGPVEFAEMLRGHVDSRTVLMVDVAMDETGDGSPCPPWAHNPIVANCRARRITRGG
jgi:hypothetical protein